VRLGVIYDSQAINRKQGGLLVRAPLLLLYSYWSPGGHICPSWPKYTKIPPQKGGNSYFLIEKSPKTAF
jgi:hypothetical protein